MSDEINGGGAAFPSVQEYQMLDGDFQRNHNLGMSLCDWFAGQALSGMLAYYNKYSGDYHTNASPEETANKAYEWADAMIAAREGRKNEDE